MGSIEEIKERLDIVQVVSETVKLRKSGKNYVGFCPFHPNTRTPAFAVFPESGTWRCFGACNEGGDIFKFVMKREGWEFREALDYLAEKAGVELKPRSPQQEEEESRLQRLREAMESALVFYRNTLLQGPEGKAALDYLLARGFSPEILERFELGFAPPSWDAARDFLLERGFSEEELLLAGLVGAREQGGVYDRFRNRIMIPIRDARGRIAGFGARAMSDEDHPKYLNSPQTPLFDKGRLLYGMDKARKAIRKADQAVVVEGYMDVIGLHQAGFENAVSPMGTALTMHQLRLIKRYTRRMILALDADVAGSQATLRGLTLAREAMDRSADPIFDARGLVRYEGRLDADLRVVSLPPGKDPDEVALADPASWEELVAGAQPIIPYVLDVLCQGKDLDDAKVKAQIARQVLPLLDDVADAVEREAYRQEIARRLKVDERALLGWRPPARRAARRSRAAPGAETLSQPLPGGESPLERFCLGVLLWEPELIYRIDRQFQALEMERLGPDDFSGADHQVIFHAVQQALAQDEEEPGRYWRRHLVQALREHAEGMLAELNQLGQMAPLSIDQPKVFDEIVARFLQLRKVSLESRLGNLQFLLQAAQEAGTPPQEVKRDVLEYQRQVSALATQKARVEQALARRQGHVEMKSRMGW
jgi:DNA primase